MPFSRGNHDSITPVGYRQEYKGKHVAEPTKPKYDIDKAIADEKESLHYLNRSYNTLKKIRGENHPDTRHAKSQVDSAKETIRRLEREKKNQ